jgi:hypothetical protein
MDYIKMFSMPLKEISAIMKSDSKDKAREIFPLLSRNLIKDEELKEALIFRLSRCIYDDILDLEKYSIYFDEDDTMKMIIDSWGMDVKWLPGDEKIKTIYEEKKWPDLEKILKAGEMEYCFLNHWRGESSNENNDSGKMGRVLMKHGVRRYDSAEDAKEIVRKFRIRYEGSYYTGIDRIPDFWEMWEDVMDTWKEDYPEGHPRRGVAKRTGKREYSGITYFMELLKLMENATKYGEDAVVEYI